MKSDQVAGASVICRDERGVVILAKDWMLARFIVPLTELFAAQ